MAVLGPSMHDFSEGRGGLGMIERESERERERERERGCGLMPLAASSWALRILRLVRGSKFVKH
jgi:hypothetical protein